MIDFDAPTPLYVQIADHLQRRIADGDITRRLPGVRVIADTYGVAHATAARAVKDLVARGVAVSVPGRGLPTAREFADEFGISARTVTDALAVLRESGEVIGVRGRGVFVRPDAN